MRGKTTLQNQVLGRLSKEGYDTVALSLTMASRTIFEELDPFLKWFCAAVSRELNFALIKLVNVGDDISISQL